MLDPVKFRVWLVLLVVDWKSSDGFTKDWFLLFLKKRLILFDGLLSNMVGLILLIKSGGLKLVWFFVLKNEVHFLDAPKLNFEVFSHLNGGSPNGYS